MFKYMVFLYCHELVLPYNTCVHSLSGNIPSKLKFSELMQLFCVIECYVVEQQDSMFIV